MSFITDNIVEICSAIGGLTLLNVAIFYYDSEKITNKSLNREITDEEADAGYHSYKVIKPSRASKISKKLGL